MRSDATVSQYDAMKCGFESIDYGFRGECAVIALFADSFIGCRVEDQE